jgi:hypothetical protein
LEPGPTARRGPSRETLALVAVFAGALLISGFTVLRAIDPFDEGLALQAARRVTEGELPYRDFLWAYGPGGPYALAGLRELFGASLLDWRVLRVLVDAGLATTVFALVRRETAHGRLAAAAALFAACALADPRSANPTAYALLFALIGFAVAAGGHGAVTARRAVAAGALIGAAAAFRLDFAVFALVAALVALALRGSRRALAVCAAATALVTLAVYAPFLIAIGPGDLYDALLGTSLRESAYWSLPFPLVYRGGLGGPAAWKDALEFYEPLLLVIGLALAAVAVALRWRAERRPPPLAAGLVVLGIGFALYLNSRTDPFHTQPLDVTLAVLLPLALVAAMRWRPLAAGLAAVLALVTLLAVANRAVALLDPPAMATVGLPAADGVKAPPDEARALEQAVPLVRQLVPPGEPIYVLPRRSDLATFSAPVIYVLADRDNPTPRDHGLLTGAAAQRSIVAALERVRPKAVVRWTDPLSSKPEPNRRGRSSGVTTVDDWVGANYGLRARFGFYDVLVPR